MAKVHWLNLGCGNDYRPSTAELEWTNADGGDCPVDVHFDIEHIPGWSILDTGYFDHIYCCQVLEHINRKVFPDVLRQMYRVSRKGAIWDIIVPHGFSDNYITDPTHQLPFSTRTFDYFIDDLPETERGLRENGLIYGWGDIHLSRVEPPAIDGNQSIHFLLKVEKND